MAVEFSWLIPNRVILQRFYGDVTLEDIRESDRVLPAFVAEGIPLVHTLTDVRDITSHPNLKEIHGTASMATYEGEGWRVLVGAQGIARFIGSVLFQLMGQRYRMFDTMEEGLQFIIDHDDSIDMPEDLPRTGS